MQRFTPKQYLQIDIANNFGLDKRTWNERLAWFEENQGKLHELLPKAEEPALFFAGIQAWEAFQKGEPSGYPISLDATSSGLQLLAVLTGDRSASELCNVVPKLLDFSPQAEAERRDGYTVIYKAMLSVLGEGAKIKREDVKQAIMTSLYGSQAVPKKVFGEGDLLRLFFETMKELAPAAWELNEAFLIIWDDQALSNDWVLPDNFHVHVKVMTTTTSTVNFLNEPFDVPTKINAPVKEGRSLGANTIHSVDGMIVREMTRRCSYDPAWINLLRQILNNEVDSRFATEESQKEARRMVKILWKHYCDSGYLSARILDYIDSDTILMVDADIVQELIDSLPAKSFQIFAVHDCFRCLPNYANDLREQYNRQLYLIARSNLLSYLLSQLTGRTIQVDKLDKNLHKDILQTEYALS